MSKETGHSDHIPGTYVFTGQRSKQGLKLNRFAYSLNQAKNRETYLEDPEAYIDSCGLSAWEKEKILAGDWKSLVEEGVGTSHVPSIGVAFDTNQQEVPAWKPLFDGYKPAKAWLKEIGVTHAIVIYNDHGTDFFFDKYPTFAMGAADEYPIGDESFGIRNLPTVKGDTDFSWHLANSLVKESEFDLTVCQEMTMDHGLLAPHPLLFDHEPDWSVKTVPFAVNVLQHPLPTPRRLWKLGQAMRVAVESYPEDARVVIVCRDDDVAHHARRTDTEGEQNPPKLLPTDANGHGLNRP